MAEPNSKRLRTTPRESIASDLGTPLRVSTPYTNLRNLAALIRPPSTPHAVSRTPKHNAGNPSSARRTPRSRAGPPTTPHALRALQARRAAGLGFRATPGRKRRRSAGRNARETPRDLLRNLSRVLAKRSAPVAASPLEPQHSQGRRLSRTPRRKAILDDEFDIGPDPKAPRMSLSRAEMEAESEEDTPPRLSSVAVASDEGSDLEVPEISGVLDEDATALSVESGRRDRMQPRQSLASQRFAMLAAELRGLPPADRYGEEGAEAGEGDETTQIIMEADGQSFVVENTADVQSVLEAARRRRSERLSLVSGDESILSEPDEPTFVFRVPEGMRRSSVAPIQVTQQDLEDLIELGASDFPLEADDDDPEEDLEELNRSLTELERDLQEIGLPEGDTTVPFTGPIDDDNDNDNNNLELDIEPYITLLDDPVTTSLTLLQQPTKGPKLRQKKKALISKYGTPYPSLPTTLIKRLSTAFARSAGAPGQGKIGKDTLAELERATDWFFEQTGGDLAAYAEHRGGSKTIENADVVALMRRQRQVTAGATPFSLAQRHLPGELVRELRMPGISGKELKRRAGAANGGRGKGKRKRGMETIEEDEEDDETEITFQGDESTVLAAPEEDESTIV